MSSARRRVCFVTGTRAEFGLMKPVLRAIDAHRSLKVQIIATGMHLDRKRGGSLQQIAVDGWRVDGVVPWNGDRARATGAASARIADALGKLKSDIVIVVGDRVEALAGAMAGHLSGRIVAHVHGGDRALGQIDDSLRHAITKLSHIHFPATRASAQRISRLGEDQFRIHMVGSPAIDGILGEAGALDPSLKRRMFALLALHPVVADAKVERARADMILRAVHSIGFDRIVIIGPNNDPGSDGILDCWRAHRRDEDVMFLPNAPRARYLGLLRNAAVLVGNSSSGIIEAASFGTPVVDIGPRQLEREKGANVMAVPYRRSSIAATLRVLWNNGRSRRFPRHNVYGRGDTGRQIASILAGVTTTNRWLNKLITY